MSKTVDPEKLMREALESVERISREHSGAGQGPAPAASGEGVEIDTDPPAGSATGGNPAVMQAMEAQIETLSKELEAAQAQAKEAEDKYKRSLAEQENFRKRTQKERLDQIRFGHEKFAGEVLQTLDNLERALSHLQGLPEDPAVEQLVTGIKMTAAMFQQSLDKFGIRPVAGLGSPFDPAIHQAMQQIETADVPPGQVVDLYQKGYMIYERLLRPALVGVSKPPSAAESAPAEGAAGSASPSGEGGGEVPPGSGEPN